MQTTTPIQSSFPAIFPVQFSSIRLFVLGLSIDPVKKQIIFSCNDEKIIYSILTPVYALNVNGPSRALQSRIYGNPGQGYMFVEVDNVYISNELLLTPTNRDVSRYEGTTTFAVSNLGDETLPWSTEVVSGADWLKINIRSKWHRYGNHHLCL